MEFNNKMFDWQNEGTEPSSSLKQNGFTGGYKPPASVFNHFWSKVTKAITELQTKLSGLDNAKVDKVTGKGLSTNDYTTDEKTKLSGIETGANKYSLPTASASTKGGVKVGDKLSITGDTLSADAGKSLAGKTVQPASASNVTAGVGAEIFNDYRSRTFSNGIPIQGNIASGDYSHVEGQKNTAQGIAAHAEGTLTKANGSEAHAEGYSCFATGDFGSHAEGWNTEASGVAAHSEGSISKAYGLAAHAEGSSVANGEYAHGEGTSTSAYGNCSHAEGFSSYRADAKIAITDSTTNDEIISAWQALENDSKFSLALGKAHCEGNNCLALGTPSHAEGWRTIASGNRAHSEGVFTYAKGDNSHAGGCGTIANAYQTVIGKYNKESTGPTSSSDNTGDIFIVGGGKSSTRANALRTTSAGKTYGLSTFGASGADYAECFEWIDGNPNSEDRRGYFVTLDGEKIRKANAEDTYILGVVSATPVILGDVQSELWHDTYLKDIFGEKLTETVEVEETTDEDGKVIPAHTEVRWILNPKYDPDKVYLGRERRKEWTAVGMLGKLVVVDDGTCQVNGYCKVSANGTATQNETGYRVIKRLDDNHIKILLK